MFYPIRIAQIPGFGFVGGPEFSTDIQSLASGREKRNALWSEARHKYTAPFANISDAAFRAIKDVHLVMRGRLHTFLHRDWADYTATNEQFAVGDGVTETFQLIKTSRAGAGTYVRTILCPNLIDPIATPLVIYASGVAVPGAVVSGTTGLVTFAEPPALGAVLSWTGEFDVPVRFDIDYLPFKLDDRNGGGFITNGSIDIFEVLDL